MDEPIFPFYFEPHTIGEWLWWLAGQLVLGIVDAFIWLIT